MNEFERRYIDELLKLDDDSFQQYLNRLNDEQKSYLIEIMYDYKMERMAAYVKRNHYDCQEEEPEIHDLKLANEVLAKFRLQHG